MRNPILVFLFATLLLLRLQPTNAQTFQIDVTIINQPDEYILLETVQGDNYTLIDRALPENGKIHFELQSDAHPGIYRLILGKTGYARVMNQDPQLLDFIFNKENVQLKTDFKNPLQTVQVIHSSENDVYFDFLIRLKEYESELSIMEQEADSYWAKGDSAKAISASNEVNRLQLDWDLRVAQTVQQNNSLFASKLIGLKRIPLKDAFLSPKERSENYRNEFLQTVNFSDETLIYSTAYTDKIFEFLTLYNNPEFNKQQRTAAYMEAVDRIFSKMGQNEQVDQFITEYLLHGFQVLEMKELIDHINEKTK